MSGTLGEQSSGLFAGLKNIAATLLASGKTRLELLGNEVEEEKLRVVHLVLMAQGMVFCLGFATLIILALLTALFWESRIQLLAAAASFFLVLGGVFYALFKRSVKRQDRIFSASIAELEEDLRQLREAVGRE